MPYAEGTSVPVDRTKGEIERLVEREGGTRLSHGWLDDNTASVSWVMRGRLVRFSVARPDPAQAPRRKNTLQWASDEWRRRWRTLLLILKAKLEAVREGSGITEFDQEFLSHIVGAGGETVYEWIKLEQQQGRFLLPAVEK